MSLEGRTSEQTPSQRRESVIKQIDSLEEGADWVTLAERKYGLPSRDAIVAYLGASIIFLTDRFQDDPVDLQLRLHAVSEERRKLFPSLVQVEDCLVGLSQAVQLPRKDSLGISFRDYLSRDGKD
jgi:hypothetical protein